MKGALGIVAKVVVLLGLLAGAGGLLTARVVQEGERELRMAEALSATGKLEAAVVHARQSALWFAPGAPHVPAAYAKMISIARLAEGRGDIKTALFAWQAVRTSALSTRWVLVPHQDELAVANASIARLAAKTPAGGGAQTQDPGEVQQKLHMLLARKDRPRLPWVVTLLAGFASLCVGFIHLGWKGIPGEGGLQPKRLRFGAIAVVVGLVAWVLALWNA